MIRQELISDWRDKLQRPCPHRKKATQGIPPSLEWNLPSQRRASHSSRDPNRTILWCNPSTSLNYQVKWSVSFPSRTCQIAISSQAPGYEAGESVGHLTQCRVDGCCWFYNVLQMYYSDVEENTSLIAMPWDGLTGYNFVWETADRQGMWRPCRSCRKHRPRTSPDVQVACENFAAGCRAQTPLLDTSRCLYRNVL